MITIVYHKKYCEKIIKAIKNSTDKELCYHIGIEKEPIILYNLQYNKDIVNFYSVEFLEQYKRSAIFMQTIYYPQNEESNEDLITTLKICSRGVTFLIRNFLPSIFSYDEDAFFSNNFLW